MSGFGAIVGSAMIGIVPYHRREGEMLLVTGASLMQGYLDQPERTADVIRDGWYVTGDIARERISVGEKYPTISHRHLLLDR